LLLKQWNLLPQGETINLTVAGLLITSTVLGWGLSAMIYWNSNWQKPVKLPSQAVQDFFAYDFYTAKLYRVTIIFVVGLISNTMYWIDRYIVDGFVNLVGIATVFSGQSLKYNVSGQTQFYALTIILGVTLLLGFFTLNLF
jgi:NAD(P)H-quinone oxidoreductase subunit 5